MTPGPRSVPGMEMACDPAGAVTPDVIVMPVASVTLAPNVPVFRCALGEPLMLRCALGEPLVVVGHEGPWFRPPPDLTGCPTGFRLLVSHTPDNIRWARRHDCRLMLSGHNHGGQIRMPVVGSMFVLMTGWPKVAGIAPHSPLAAELARSQSGTKL